MITGLELTRTPPNALAAAAAVQGRAFFDDPAFTFTWRDDAERRERLPWLMQVGIGCGLRFGHVDTTTGAMLGHAVWLRPGETYVTAEMLHEFGFGDAAERMGEQALARFGMFMEVASEAHDRLMPDRHWFLMILGVDPPFQGQGVGSTLISPTLALADADGLPCYLETTKERNVAFYRKHGFEIGHQADISDGGDSLRVWMMIREPH
jgi:ribosomal protein S18 acetylase RimI-like enzyme